jgi:hypothetical protein
MRNPFLMMPLTVGLLGALAMAAEMVFVLNETRIAARGTHALWEPAADATLVFGLSSALIITGTALPSEFLFDGIKHIADSRQLGARRVGRRLPGWLRADRGRAHSL